MGKIVALIRTSTDKQQTEDQRNEMIEYCQSLGYGKRDIVIIENQGASAIKMDEKYMGMISKLKSEILDNHAEAVGVWMLDRLGRNEIMLMELKNFFIENKIQLYIKNPSLSLLNSDGTVNNGAELAISLFITMSKQEMMEKQARFKRRKKVMSEQCLFTGGTVRYGYKVDTDGRLIINEDEAQLIRMIFTMFSTGKYSVSTLWNELNERGITRTDGKLPKIWIRKVLLETAYIGRKDSDIRNTHRNYIPIISKDIFDVCQEIKRKNDTKQDKSRKKDILSVKLVICPVCGSHYVSSGSFMKCWRHIKSLVMKGDVCPNKITIPIDVVDGLVWRVAATEYISWLMNDKDIQIKELEEQRKITVQKIDALQKKIDDVDKERKKVGSAWLDNLITDEEKEKRLSKIEVRNKNDKANLAKMASEIDKIDELLKEAGNNDEVERWADIAVGVVEEKDRKAMYDIAHRFIKEVKPERVVVPELNHYRITKFSITTYTGRTEDFFMVSGKKHTVYRYIRGEYKVFDFERIGRN